MAGAPASGCAVGAGSEDWRGVADCWRRAIRRAVEFAAPVDGIDIEAERVLAQYVGLLRR
jgi:hypothetical protein